MLDATRIRPQQARARARYGCTPLVVSLLRDQLECFRLLVAAVRFRFAASPAEPVQFDRTLFRASKRHGPRRPNPLRNACSSRPLGLAAWHASKSVKIHPCRPVPVCAHRIDQYLMVRIKLHRLLRARA